MTTRPDKFTNDPIPERLVSRKTAATTLELSVESIKRLEKAGRLRAIKLNSRVTRYRKSDLEKLIADGLV